MTSSLITALILAGAAALLVLADILLRRVRGISDTLARGARYFTGELRRASGHDRRVAELLDVNNRYLERARVAERQVKALERSQADEIDAYMAVIECLQAEKDKLLVEREERIQERDDLEVILTQAKDALTQSETEAEKWSAEAHDLRLQAHEWKRQAEVLGYNYDAEADAAIGSVA